MFVVSASVCSIVCSILFILIFLYSNIVVLTVCCFPCYLMAFDCQELKGLLTYLLTCSSVVAGIFFVLPCIDTYTKVDLRTVSFDVPPQEVGPCIYAYVMLLSLQSINQSITFVIIIIFQSSRQIACGLIFSLKRCNPSHLSWMSFLCSVYQIDL